MKTESVSKIKYLKLWDILRQETDEQHPMSTTDIIARLAALGISCDRRTLYRNIDELNEYGFEILKRKGNPNGYYVEDRSFEVPELQILMDAVSAASFITDKKTPVLIDKIAQLAGSQRAELLKNNIVQFGTVKGSNESIYYSVNEISQAIIAKRKIGFYYFNYDIHHNRKYRMRTSKPDEQRWYIVNPVATVFHDDKYYLFCYNDYHGNIVQYRVDRMEQVKMLDDEITPSKEASDFDLSKHQRSLVGMYRGKVERVHFIGEKGIVDAVFDKFGESVKIYEHDADTISFAVDVQVSSPFLAWVIGFGESLKVTSPQSVIDELKERIKASMRNYEG